MLKLERVFLPIKKCPSIASVNSTWSISGIAGGIILFDIPFSNQLFLCFVRRALVMEYIDGIPILNLGDEIAKRGIDPGGKIAVVAKR